MNLKEINERINYYVRLQTFPVAVRMCQSIEEVPSGALIPSRDWGFRILECQARSLARRFGMTVAVGKKDNRCPYAHIAFGFSPFTEAYLAGDFTTGYMNTREAAANAAKTNVRLEYGKYSHLLMAPLDQANFEPHVIIIYGDGAQIMRLMQGSLRGRGGALTSCCIGMFGCSQIVQTMVTNDCLIYIPAGAERMAALCQDHEICFMAPMSKAEQLIEGLKGGAEAHLTDYPVRGYIGAEPPLPPDYAALLDYLEKLG